MNFTKIHIFLLNIFLLPSIASGTVVQTCSKGFAPHYVNITNCEREPCQFPIGQTVGLSITFTVPKYSATMKPVAAAYVIPGVPVNYPLPDEGCTSIVNGYCPVYEDEILLYSFSMPIDNYPKISFTLQFELKSDMDETITCFRAKCVVV